MSKRYDFAFNVSGLAEYINQNQDLISKVVYNSQTLQLEGLQRIEGQKHDFKLTRVDNDIYFQDLACGWNTSGNTTFDQVLIEIEPLMIQEALCPTDFDQKYLGTLSARGSTPETFPFEQFIIESKTDKMTGEIDKMAWQGDKAGGTGNLAKVDGYGTFLSGSTTDVYVAAASGTSTASDIEAKIELMINSVDERVYDKADLTLFMSVANYKLLVAAQVANNSYNYNTNVDGKTLTTEIAAHGITVRGMHGLRGTNFWYLTPISNMVFGTDLLDETDSIDSWYERKGSQVLVEAKMKLGFGFEYDWMVVHNNPNL